MIRERDTSRIFDAGDERKDLIDDQGCMQSRSRSPIIEGADSLNGDTFRPLMKNLLDEEGQGHFILTRYINFNRSCF